MFRQRQYAVCFSLLLLSIGPISTVGCVGGHALVRRDAGDSLGLSWFTPALVSDTVSLQRWETSVGPPLIRPSAAPVSPSHVDQLTIVSWNTAVGEADVVRFILELRRMQPDVPIVLLLQEVFRRGADVPRTLVAGASFASRLGTASSIAERRDIARIAADTSLNLYYVPSMRNGAPDASDEDRGNAVLSSLPLSSLEAIELPFERQRRVAVSATISGISRSDGPWRLRVVSAHLDNMVGPRRLWFAGGEYARARQARALVEHLGESSATVLAGDFNTWFGFADRAYVETARAFPDARATDRRATFHGLLRLDHIFYRLPSGWVAEYRRGDQRFGSDHFPLIATVWIR
jgi:endonuclease/exonuclease/phosphatase family metal-dependent hydrolase